MLRLKFLLYLHLTALFMFWIASFLKGEKYEQTLSTTIQFMLALCTLIICETIEKEANNDSN